MSKDNTILKPFEFHGVEFDFNTATKSQAKADCIFCGGNSGKNKFYVNTKTGQCQCKVCGFKGNVNSFLSAYHQMMFDNGTSNDLKKIRGLRDNCFPTTLLREHQLCFNETGELLFPQKNPEAKSLSNLRKWSPETGKLYNTPDCYSLYFAQWVENPEAPIFLCEGEWDALALIQLMRRAKYEKECCILSVPGCGGFKDVWAKRFTGRTVTIIFDNDHTRKRKDGTKFNPAQEGTDATVAKLNGVAKKIRTIRWEKFGKELADGFDIRDVLKQAIQTKKSKATLNRLLRACRTVETGPVKEKKIIYPLKRTSFSEVVADFKKVYSVNQSFEDALACAIATVVALKIKGNPLWMFLVAPPSSGKSVIIEAFENAFKYTVHLSTLTSTSLVSGSRTTRKNEDGEDEEYDPSAYARLKDKVLFIKDFTTLLSSNENEKRAVYGILRDGYDGSFRRPLGNGEDRNYEDHYFGIFAGVTHAIHGENQAELGERFLKINLIDSEFDEVAHMRQALLNTKKNVDNRPLINGSIWGFLEHLATIDNVPELPETSPYFDKLTYLALLVAKIRTKVKRVSGRDMAYRPETETGSRIATQLLQLGSTFALVHGKSEFDADCYRVMQKVALDSCVGYQLEVLNVIDRSDDGMSASMVAESINLSINQVRKILDDMMQLNLIEMRRQSNNSGRRGNKINKFRITEKVRELMENAELSFKGNKRIETPSTRTKRSRKTRRKTGRN